MSSTLLLALVSAQASLARAARCPRLLRDRIVQGLSGRCCFVSGTGSDVRLPGLWHIVRKQGAIVRLLEVPVRREGGG